MTIPGELTPGMVLLVNILEAIPRHTSVNLRSGYIAVPKKHLHDSKIGPMIEQMGGECMTEGVG